MDMNRRAMFGATVAVAALAAPAITLAQPEAEAVELERQFIALNEACIATYADISEKDEIWATMRPAYPDVLRPRAGDYYIESLRLPGAEWWETRLYPVQHLKAVKAKIDPTNPKAEWQAARCDELIAGVRTYWRNWNRTRRKCGLAQACKRGSALDDEMAALTEKIVQRPATSAADFRLQARVALSKLPSVDDRNSDEAIIASALEKIIKGNA